MNPTRMQPPNWPPYLLDWLVVIRDESQLPPLQEAMLTGELTYVDPIRTRLRRYATKLRPQWLELLRNPRNQPPVASVRPLASWAWTVIKQ
jgi:hypothetical protein